MDSIVDIVIGLACFSLFAVPALTLIWLTLITLQLDYQAIKRSVRRPRFGVKALFLLTAVVAVDLTIVRALGVDLSSTAAIWAILLVGAFAVGGVGGVWLVARDFRDTFVEKRPGDRISKRRHRRG
ncbi:MAG: hypothetical protein CMJ50_09540 [Planctomycetaceae bacterium]|nr:hypothetical protein [Planctomycetaceae bacterium]